MKVCNTSYQYNNAPHVVKEYWRNRRAIDTKTETPIHQRKTKLLYAQEHVDELNNEIDKYKFLYYNLLESI